MITRKPSALEMAQLVCAVLVVTGLVMILPLGWVFLIVGLAGLGVAVGFEIVKLRTPAPPTPPQTEGD